VLGGEVEIAHVRVESADGAATASALFPLSHYLVCVDTQSCGEQCPPEAFAGCGLVVVSLKLHYPADAVVGRPPVVGDSANGRAAHVLVSSWWHFSSAVVRRSCVQFTVFVVVGCAVHV